MTAGIDLAATVAALANLPRTNAGAPDPEATGRLIAVLWLGGPDAFARQVGPLPDALHSTLVEPALAVVTRGASGAAFVAQLRAGLADDQRFVDLLSGVDRWLAAALAREFVDRDAPALVAAPRPVAETATGRSPPGATSDPGAVPDRIAGFEVLDLLGEGGMGRVFRARQVSLDRLVALKVLAESLADDVAYVERLEREAKAAARLSHPNVVGVIETGRCSDTGLAFIAFEYVAGKTAEDLLRSVGKLPEAEALTLCLAVTSALECAEEHGIIHRDIKPANLIIGVDGIPRLLDLGLAKAKGDGGSAGDRGVMFEGTPRYLSPEQGLGLEDVDHRADLYSLGICLFEFLTGRVPYEDTSAIALVMRHTEEDVPDPRTLEPALTPHVARLVAGLCARDREQRYGGAREARAAIERVLAGKPPAAPGAAGLTVADEGGIRAGPSSLGRRAGAGDAADGAERRPTTALRTRERSADALAAAELHLTRFAADPLLADHLGVPSASLVRPRASEGMLLSDDMRRAYPIRRCLGEGPRGATYEVGIMGDQGFPGFERPVEVAIIKVGKEKDALRQTQKICATPNRHIVCMLDSGSLQDGQPYLVFEQLQTNPYERFAQRRARRVDPATAANVFLNVLESLRHLHARPGFPIVHGGLSPAVVLLRMPSVGGAITDDEYLLRLAQGRYETVVTGLGKALHRSLLEQTGGRATAFAGHPLYLAPESTPTLTRDKLAPGTYSPKSDAYALCLVFYVLLTGDLPFAWRGLYELYGAEFLCELLDLQRAGVPPHDKKLLAQHLGSAAGAVTQLLEAGLAADPNLRPGPTALAKTARRLLEATEVAGPPDRAYRFDSLDNVLRLRQGLFPNIDLANNPYR